jgi:hypothetical protein
VAHPAPVGLVARVCRLCGGFLVPAALPAGARAGLSAGAEGVGPRLGAVTAWACTAGERGVAGNVGRTGPAHGDPDGTGDDRRQRRDRGAGARDSRRFRRWRRACRPHPSPVPSPGRYGARDTIRRPRRRRPTTPAPHQDSRRRRGYDGNVAQTSPPHPDCDVTSYIDGNVAQDVRTGDSCDVTVVGAGTTGHTLPPYPAHAVTAPRATQDAHGAADRPRPGNAGQHGAGSRTPDIDAMPPPSLPRRKPRPPAADSHARPSVPSTR